MRATYQPSVQRLESASNFTLGKVKVSLIILVNVIWEFANTKLTLPTYAAKVVTYNQKGVKSRRIILDVVKDHVIPHPYLIRRQGRCGRL
jgi:hypothetical protein